MRSSPGVKANGAYAIGDATWRSQSCPAQPAEAVGRAAHIHEGLPYVKDGQDLESTGMMSLRVVRTFEEFENLSVVWNGLLAESRADQIFLRWEWQYTWAKHYLDQDQLWIILVYEDEQTVGIAPFYRKTRCASLLRWRQLGFLGDGEVCSAYLDVIATEKKKDEALPVILSFL
ncbi:MAG: hypothetical protein ACRD2L_11160, partial [Terriglobia bacterium]